MSPATAQLPTYLKKYIFEQRYENYTPRDHAAWRYIMRQNRAFFGRHAVPVYLEGLKKTGIPVDRIPRITEMDDCLAELGWGAVPVRGFIPPAAFLDFQARAVLPIACDMRSVQHIAYTPAPDIVHEAAGHAPIIADPAYSAYLHRYAKMAQKAILSLEDLRLYEAIRYLSDIKENPDTKPDEIERADARLKATAAAMTHVSEAAMVARMAWWTVEYGLVGDLAAPKIYGAGLLSSVGESQACLSYKVRKVPLSVDCVHQPYDITEPQPQLFVARSMEHLVEILLQFERTLAFQVGGVEGLKRARRAETVNTIVLPNGLQISGKLIEHAADEDVPTFVKFAGPVQLAYGDRQIDGHGRERHGDGFSSPLGRFLKASVRAPHTFTDEELATFGVAPGKRAILDLETGVRVEGTVVGTTRRDGKLLLITWKDCTVRRGDEVLFRPEWGEFDQAIGEAVPSVFGGPADMDRYGDIDIGQATTSPARATPYTAHELKTFDAYRALRNLRQQGDFTASRWTELVERVVREHADEWLLHLELVEVACHAERSGVSVPWKGTVTAALDAARNRWSDVDRELLDKGIALASQADPLATP
jgi:phenylalanine-4-hydroxylase